MTPSINQIEVNPFLYRKKTIEWCQKAGIRVQAYRALRDGKAFEHPTILAVAAKHGKTAAQVLGRWLVPPLPSIHPGVRPMVCSPPHSEVGVAPLPG